MSATERDVAVRLENLRRRVQTPPVTLKGVATDLTRVIETLQRVYPPTMFAEPAVVRTEDVFTVSELRQLLADTKIPDDYTLTFALHGRRAHLGVVYILADNTTRELVLSDHAPEEQQS